MSRRNKNRVFKYPHLRKVNMVHLTFTAKTKIGHRKFSDKGMVMKFQIHTFGTTSFHCAKSEFGYTYPSRSYFPHPTPHLLLLLTFMEKSPCKRMRSMGIPLKMNGLKLKVTSLLSRQLGL